MKRHDELIKESEGTKPAPINEEWNIEKVAKVKEFDDSATATDFMYGIGHLLKSKPLMGWAKITDENYSVRTVGKLKTAIAAYDAFLEEIERAE